MFLPTRLVKINKRYNNMEWEDMEIIETTNFKKHTQKYCTISYVWKLGKPKINILVNAITSLTDYFWIDQLCIMQNNIKDKENEIKKMGDYYRNSFINFCWVNNINLNSVSLFCNKFLNQFEKGFDEITWNKFITENIYDLKNLIQLFKHEWFNRVWTFQEALLPNISILISENGIYELYKVIDTYMKLKTMIEFGIINQHDYINDMDAIENIGALSIIFEYKNNDYISFSKCMEIINMRESTLTHDKVYGIIGLLQIETLISYKITPEEAYWNIAIACMKKGDMSPMMAFGYRNIKYGWCMFGDFNYLKYAYYGSNNYRKSNIKLLKAKINEGIIIRTNITQFKVLSTIKLLIIKDISFPFISLCLTIDKLSKSDYTKILSNVSNLKKIFSEFLIVKNLIYKILTNSNISYINVQKELPKKQVIEVDNSFKTILNDYEQKLSTIAISNNKKYELFNFIDLGGRYIYGNLSIIKTSNNIGLSWLNEDIISGKVIPNLDVNIFNYESGLLLTENENNINGVVVWLNKPSLLRNIFTLNIKKYNIILHGKK